MTIVITLPNPALKQRAAKFKTDVKNHREHIRYERMIRMSQKKIGPHIP